MFSNVDTSILQPLIRHPETSTLVAALQKKFFDFDRKFYHEALHLVESLGFRNHPDYSYLQTQCKTCEQIYTLS